MFHRGTFGPVAGHPKRLMLKLWFTRCRDNPRPSWKHSPHGTTDVVFGHDPFGQRPVWESVWRWMLGAAAPPPPLSPHHGVHHAELATLVQALRGGAPDATAEPARVAAAYALAAAGPMGPMVPSRSSNGWKCRPPPPPPPPTDRRSSRS
eukprot:SAG22_NODE_1863_length_3419_cov_2.175301_3_plen_150_part_00